MPTKKELDSVQITAEMVIKRLDTFKVVSLGIYIHIYKRRNKQERCGTLFRKRIKIQMG